MSNRAGSGIVFIIGLFVSLNCAMGETLRVTDISIPPGAVLSSNPNVIEATFNSWIWSTRCKDAACLGSHDGTWQLVRSGGDGTFGDANDVIVSTSDPVWLNPVALKLQLPATLLSDTYQSTIFSSDKRYGYLFDGLDDQITLPQNVVINRRDITIEARFMPMGAGTVFGFQDSPIGVNPAGYVPAIYVGEDHRIRAGFWTDVPVILPTSETSYTPGEWINIALAGDGQGYSVYMDGNLLGSNNRPYTMEYAKYCQIGTNHATPIWPGVSHAGQFPFAGQVSEVRVWDSKRTEQQIKDTLDRPLTGQEPGLVAIWRFDRYTFTIIEDLSPNNNDAILGTTAGSESSDPEWVAGGILDSTNRTALDGEFSGTFPSGDGVPGGDFITQFTLDLGMQVIEPNGGEKWFTSSTHTIRWSAPDSDTVTIEVSHDGGANWQMVADAIPNTGSYLWEFPAVASDRYLIRLTDNLTRTDTSDDFFGIYDKTTNPFTDINLDGFIDYRDLLILQGDWHTLVNETPYSAPF